MNHLKSLDTDDPSLHGWTFHTERGGIRIYSKRLPGESIPTFRGEGWIDGNWSLEDIAAVVRTLGARQICKCQNEIRWTWSSYLLVVFI
jgi:hypothetical protein